MILATPLAAIGFATAGILAAVYCFRRRSPPKTVGSLLLWPRPALSLSAARRRDRLRTPPRFWLELLILLALVTAALTPLRWRRSSGSLTVILDTSPSMSAGDTEKRAKAFLEREMKRGTKERVRVRTAPDARALERELSSAKATQLPGDEILVLTDRPPQTELPANGLRWEAFGAPLPNSAITAVRRRRRDPDRDTVFIEVRRFGDGPVSCPLTIEGVGQTTLTFDDKGRARFAGDLPAATPPVTASIPQDALNADNTVRLDPPDVLAVSARLDFADDGLAALVKRALDATGFVREYVSDGDTPVDLLATDRASDIRSAYRLVFLPSGTNAIRGPVWTDPGEPILDGVTLDGLSFALSETPPTGFAVAAIGGHPLIAIDTDRCTLAFSHPRLAFFRSPAFPALVQNAVTAASATAQANAQSDTAPKRQAAGVLDADESDLTRCASGSFGAPAAIPEQVMRTHSIAWIPAAVAVAALLLYGFLYRAKIAFVLVALVLLAMARPVFPKN